ncbi:MAG TPA: diacylglycerol kinase [Ruminococcaceae bacterium]|nr:diacylglycerol kinase [Oscillospiraceae bacterium]
MKHVFVINPCAGKGKAVSVIEPMIREYFIKNGGNYEIHVTECSAEGIDFVRKYPEGEETVRFYACGGDGTLFEVVNGAYGKKNVEVAVIPLGSGNDFIRLFGTTEQFINVEAQVNGKPLQLDVIKCMDKIAVNQCSMGIDAEVCAKQGTFKKFPLFSGETAYTVALLYCFFGRMKSIFTVRVDDGEAFTQPMLFCVGANSRWYGGGYMAAPHAMPNDGLLDFIIVKKNMPRIKLLSLINQYKKGKHLDWNITNFMRGKKLTIHSEKPAAVNVDGECEYVTDCSFEIIEKGITFVVPTTSTYFDDVEKGIICDSKPLVR